MKMSFGKWLAVIFVFSVVVSMAFGIRFDEVTMWLCACIGVIAFMVGYISRGRELEPLLDAANRRQFDYINKRTLADVKQKALANRPVEATRLLRAETGMDIHTAALVMKGMQEGTFSVEY